MGFVSTFVLYFSKDISYTDYHGNFVAGCVSSKILQRLRIA
jgi:hypothetical protein